MTVGGRGDRTGTVGTMNTVPTGIEDGCTATVVAHWQWLYLRVWVLVGFGTYEGRVPEQERRIPRLQCFSRAPPQATSHKGPLNRMLDGAKLRLYLQVPKREPFLFHSEANRDDHSKNKKKLESGGGISCKDFECRGI
ncbi:hypothetical protein V8E52_008816 [Russula decolorans]